MYWKTKVELKYTHECNTWFLCKILSEYFLFLYISISILPTLKHAEYLKSFFFYLIHRLQSQPLYVLQTTNSPPIFTNHNNWIHSIYLYSFISRQIDQPYLHMICVSYHSSVILLQIEWRHTFWFYQLIWTTYVFNSVRSIFFFFNYSIICKF